MRGKGLNLTFNRESRPELQKKCKNQFASICYMLLVKVTCKIGSRLEMLVGNAKRSRFSSTRKKSTSFKYPVNSNLQCSVKVK